ncbi:MAG: glycine betaine ABC transporter substrate-binding protein [Bacteroidales bacterium]
MQKLTMSLRTFMVVLVGIAVLGTTACKQEAKKGDKKEKEQVEILYPNWAEGIAFTNLAQAILQDKGYDIKITPLEPGPIYAAIAKGDADLMLDAWLPFTHEDYWEEYGDDIDSLGASFDNGTTGLVVPDYVDFESIEDLNDHVDELDGKIIGIGSGAGIHRNTEKVIEEYDLDFQQVTSSESAMMASLKRNYDKEEPVVITGWKPHQKWADYDLKYLDDPKDLYPKDVCAIIARKGFRDDHPVLAEFFTNFSLNEDQLYELMEVIDKSDDELEAAKGWYENNKEVVEEWYPEEMKE